MATTYCEIAPGHEWHGPYHDTEYGVPLTDESALFERLILEINQAGLSWLTILKKREAFRQAYSGFDVETVARYGARDTKRLLADAGIIRNRLKVEAAIHNARQVLALRQSHGGFAAWLDAHHPLPKEEWVTAASSRPSGSPAEKSPASSCSAPGTCPGRMCRDVRHTGGSSH